MNREEVLNEILSLKENNICCELTTGFGKTRIAIELLKKRKCTNILIVIPRLVLIQNWKEELKKWNFLLSESCVTFTTYVSLYKHAGKYDAVVYDEAHHLTERCFEAIEDIESDNNILLSATIPRDKKYSISYNFPNTYFYKVSLKEAIDNEVLPDPKVYLIPLELDKKIHKHNYVANPKGIKQVTCNYENRWNYIKDKRNKVTVFCTEWQYIHELSTKIEYYKRAFMACRSERIKSKWLKLAGDRLKILSNLKTDFVSDILKKLKNERTITFCNSIEQTEVLGKYNINSKNKESANNLNMFNKGEIKHITCVNMLNEGINLSDCKVGIFAVLNSSEIMIKQKNGRLLRHSEPVIIIPYYINTREQELVEKMLEDYNPELVTTTDINNIEL